VGSYQRGPGWAARSRAWGRVAVVLGCVLAAWTLAFLLRFDGQVPADRVEQLLATSPLVVVLQLAMLRASGADRHSWRYTSIPDLFPMGIAVALTAGALTVIRALAPQASALAGGEWLAVPYGVIGAYLVLAACLLGAARVLRRVQNERHETRSPAPDDETRRVLLVGAGRAGVLVAREMQTRRDLGMQPVGFVDDDAHKVGRRIVGLDVIGTTAELRTLVTEFAIDEVLITIAAASGSSIRELVRRVEQAGRRPLIVPGMHEIVSGEVSPTRFRPVAPEDLLGRDPVELEEAALRTLLEGESVLVTGAGGSIGSELARQAARFGPARLVLLERAEPALWAIHRELVDAHPRLEVVPAVADVTDAGRVGALLARHRPSVVLHAAAHKHVPMMEDNPGEAIKNNVLGTRTVVEAADEHDVARFVLVSTDKAVNPTSVMGATKRLAERYVQHVARRSGRDFVSVRFGNVLGSTGSVVPIFEQQIAAGGPVTVTHPDMRRYFMTIPEAAQLVLQAATIGESGEILVLDMGEPVRIVDLAEAMIRLSGREPHVDVPIEFSGLRPGEKLFEELSLAEEGAARTRHPKIWIGRNDAPDWRTADRDLADLLRHADGRDARVVRHLIASYVPEFQHGDTGEFRVPQQVGRARADVQPAGRLGG
jgi:FlaA1/EpsC-like NDP-sugar epimerase